MYLSGIYFVDRFEHHQVSDQLGTVRVSQNFVYCSSDSVSSVTWNPIVGNLASATTDSGYLHIFDPRINCNDRRSTVIEVVLFRNFEKLRLLTRVSDRISKSEYTFVGRRKLYLARIW